MTTTDRPAVSVLIPTYNRADLLQRCLASLREQTLDRSRYEVVVVDDCSTDATPRLLEQADGIVHFRQPVNHGPAAARNVAIRAARADLVLFLDDDIAAAPDLLEQHLAGHRDGGSDDSLGVLGRIEWHPDLQRTDFMRWLDTSGLQFAYDTWLRPGPVEPPYSAFYTANLSMHRSLLDRVGGFDERFPYPAFEDFELAFRLAQQGFRLVYRPEPLAFHTRSMDLRGFRDRMRKVGESAELLRANAPEFPLDDATLRSAGSGSGWQRLQLRLAALRDPAKRSAWYWAEVGAAYEAGRRRAG